MSKFDFSSVIIGSIAGGIFSVLASFIDISGFGILLSNVVAGFVAVYVSKQKEEYIILGGVSGILSSIIMLIITFLLPQTPLGISNLTISGFIAIAISISGGGFILGIIGGYIFKKSVKN
ncbi:MAG: hypothetical protein ACPK7O_05585 [Methanobacterium sp.]